MEDGRKHTEITLEIGDSIRIGDAVVSVIETQDHQTAVLVEDLNVVDEFGSEASLSTSQPY